MPSEAAADIPVPPAPRPEDRITVHWHDTTGAPTVSVICHAYNHAAYIEDTLNGFLAQETDFAFEIIAHDDASTDGTTEILEQYATDYPNLIRLITQQVNQYSQGKRPPRITFRTARGEFVAMCEGDDYWVSPDKLQRQIDALRANPAVDLSIHPALLWNQIDDSCTKSCIHGPCERIINVEAALSVFGGYAPTASYVFRKRAISCLPAWFFEADDLPYGDEFIQAIIGKHGLLYLPEVLSVYRIYVAGSYTDKFSKIGIDDFIQNLNASTYYINKLYDFYDIPDSAVDRKLEIIFERYFAMAKNKGGHQARTRVFRSAQKQFNFKGRWRSRFTYWLYRRKLRILKVLKRMEIAPVSAKA